jgi:queuosine precursor transporter
MTYTNILRALSCAHISLIVLSNILVQYPFQFFGLHTTWGAFSYPLIFVITDLTTRLIGAKEARKVIFKSMFPGLLVSFVLASLFNESDYPLGIFYELPLRIAFACFSAYVIGQLLDISVFQRIRKNSSWWFGPTLATTLGNIIDTFTFFTLAFYHCHHPFLNQHWLEIAWVDLGVKTISLLAFIPLYGVILGSCLHYQSSFSR